MLIKSIIEVTVSSIVEFYNSSESNELGKLESKLFNCTDL